MERACQGIHNLDTPMAASNDPASRPTNHRNRITPYLISPSRRLIRQKMIIRQRMIIGTNANTDRVKYDQ